jgi:DNA excision repair protein ERCC-2
LAPTRWTRCWRSAAAQFLAWAQQEALHRAARDRRCSSWPFPSRVPRRPARPGRSRLPRRRPGPLPAGAGAHRHRQDRGHAVPAAAGHAGQGIDKVAYLTCKGTGRLTALDALGHLRAGTPGQALRVLVMVPKDEGCEHPDKACHGDACPLAAASTTACPPPGEAVALGWLDAAAQRHMALRHGICPYYLGQELVRWADVLVGDVHHLFDGNGLLWGLMQALDWALAVLVDEAHNLVERARRCTAPSCGAARCWRPLPTAPQAVRAAGGLAAGHPAPGADTAAPYAVLDAAPDAFRAGPADRRWRAGGALPPAAAGVGALLDTALRAAALPKPGRRLERPLAVRSADRCGPACGDEADDGLPLRPTPRCACATWRRPASCASASRRCTASRCSRPRWRRRTTPSSCWACLRDTAWIDVPPAFAAEHLTVRVADGVSTRFAHRAARCSGWWA